MKTLLVFLAAATLTGAAASAHEYEYRHFGRDRVVVVRPEVVYGPAVTYPVYERPVFYPERERFVRHEWRR